MQAASLGPSFRHCRAWPLLVSSWCRLIFVSLPQRTSGRAMSRIVDSHLHVWTPDVAKFPRAADPPENLDKDGFATYERFISLMDQAGVEKAVIVQPVNYGQDYSYLVSAMNSYPDRLKGVFVADASLPVDSSEDWLENLVGSNPGWVGMRFNPYKFAEVDPKGMAGDLGLRIFHKAGDLGIPVGFMPFKGLSQHIEEIRTLIAFSPQTQVIIDHMGFFLQPATGIGERTMDEESWQSLLSLADNTQVHVKISALFRVSADAAPWKSLSDRLSALLKSFGSERLLWGSDFPYMADFCEYPEGAHAIETWPVWKEMSEQDRFNIQSGTASRLFKLDAQAPTTSSSSPKKAGADL
eukprot:gnl/MRDRNA2_/MRDRNA2_34459_c0_seq1.p1 gnl/MRDRNA2_/MRDRNA2_34459_c0~~gnl/MRDRNA2_/MRDRNA2_34459_c0_seq1.p1  ORF type:complete len:374 (+),score=68.46 gnl/MRDRNA2_/MRDRNA2_34459_c0_seq1:64-1122(+)